LRPVITAARSGCRVGSGRGGPSTRGRTRRGGRWAEPGPGGRVARLTPLDARRDAPPRADGPRDSGVPRASRALRAALRSNDRPPRGGVPAGPPARRAAAAALDRRPATLPAGRRGGPAAADLRRAASLALRRRSCSSRGRSPPADSGRRSD